jgi:glycosyltransferase involved in cell wall biosynthesis
LASVVDALADSTAQLTLVSNAEPTLLPLLRKALPTTFVPFSERRYAAELARSDVILSPKTLLNAYELAHTEYKITPGMGVGLPAIASPQRSYVEAIGDRQGGIVADGIDEWRTGLDRLRDPAERDELGARAAATVRERYSTAVTARTYLELLRSLAR